MWNTDAYPALPGETLVDGIFRLIDDTVAAGGKIRFNLDGVDTVAAFDPTSDKYNTVTSRELRYVVEKHRDSVRFYEREGTSNSWAAGVSLDRYALPCRGTDGMRFSSKPLKR